MPCAHINGAIVTYTRVFRLPLADGRRVYMDWHHYCGPEFFYDRGQRRVIDDWWEDDYICAALDWFVARGNVA